MNVPWQVKIAGKILLSRIPAGYRFWKRVKLFRLGGMEEPDYAYGIFMRHFGRVDFPEKTGDSLGWNSVPVIHCFPR